MTVTDKAIAEWLRHHAERLDAADAAMIQSAAARLDMAGKRERMLMVLDSAIAQMEAIKGER